MCTCDERAIERILFRYARCVDAADWGGLADLFRHGEVLTEGSESVVRGPDAVSALWQGVNRVHPDGTLRTQHLLTNVVVDVDPGGEVAKADAYFMVFQATDQLALQPIAGGSYEDTFHKVDGEWWFDRKTIRVKLVGDLSDHLSLSLDGDGQLSEPPPADLLALAEVDSRADAAS